MSKKKFLIFPFLVFGIHFFNATVSHMIVCVNFSVKFMYAVVWEVTRLHNSGRKHDSNNILLSLSNLKKQVQLLSKHKWSYFEFFCIQTV